MKALHRTYVRTAAAFAAALFLALPSEAQIPTGAILGGVKDGSGGAVPGATVTATNTGTQYSRATTTDAEGQYALRLLPVGNYQLTITMSGFKNYSRTGIVLEVGRNARIDGLVIDQSGTWTFRVKSRDPVHRYGRYEVRVTLLPAN